IDAARRRLRSACWQRTQSNPPLLLTYGSGRGTADREPAHRRRPWLERRLRLRRAADQTHMSQQSLEEGWTSLRRAVVKLWNAFALLDRHSDPRTSESVKSSVHSL